MKEHLKGPTAILFGMESQVDAAKLVVEFSKENDKMTHQGRFRRWPSSSLRTGRGPVEGAERTS